MNIKPVGNKVLVRRLPGKIREGLIVVPETALAQDEASATGPWGAYVIATGSKVTKVSPGEQVICHSYTGGGVKFDDSDRRLITDDMIIMTMEVNDPDHRGREDKR